MYISLGNLKMYNFKIMGCCGNNWNVCVSGVVTAT